MKVIGLTGGIGSGKTTIAKLFESLGIPVYYADIEAKELMNSSNELKVKLIDLFGENAFEDNALNRSFIANVVFKDNKKLKELNALVHPKVEKHFKNWLKDQKAAYVIQENAIIFENNKQFDFDHIITVTAPKKIKIERIIDRDNITKEQVILRMNNQLDDDFKARNSKYVIYNTDLQESKLQVKNIHKALLK